MLGHVPVVERAVRVASCNHLHISIGVFDVRLAVIDVVLMHGLLWLHHSSFVELRTIEEDSPSTKGIRVDSRGLGLAKAWVKTSRELPVAIGLLLEGKRHVVEAASDIGALADEAARQDRVAIVHYALRGWLCLTSDALGGELGEVHLAVVRGEG